MLKSHKVRIDQSENQALYLLVSDLHKLTGTVHLVNRLALKFQTFVPGIVVFCICNHFSIGTIEKKKLSSKSTLLFIKTLKQKENTHYLEIVPSSSNFILQIN
jgi:hypothetical protein